MNSLPEEVKIYLNKYGNSKWKFKTSVDKTYNAAVVIPAIKEYENIVNLFRSIIKNDSTYFNSTIFIFVINSIENSSEEIINDNKKSLSFISSIINNELNNNTKEIINSGLNIALVDASSEGNEMPEKDGGVGLARKIGMDLALTMFNYEVNNKKILICLDADCTVNNNYLTTVIETYNNKNLSAAVINYKHLFDLNDNTAPAITCYEIFLRYYLLGLKYANSLYAIQTIGSTMTCDYKSYIKVEGMNKRKAAEDFYFLEKLAKFTEVKRINETYVFPAPRSSWRVPFGTGQRINRFLSKVQDEYLLYDPQSFVILKKWLAVFLTKERLSAEDYLKKSKEISTDLFNFFVQQNFEMKYSKISESSKNNDHLLKQKIKWFDGFKTLKFIHYLRDNTFPMINMFDVLDKYFEIINIDKLNPPKLPERKRNEIPDINIQIEYLEILRKLDDKYDN